MIFPNLVFAARHFGLGVAGVRIRAGKGASAISLGSQNRVIER